MLILLSPPPRPPASRTVQLYRKVGWSVPAVTVSSPKSVLNLNPTHTSVNHYCHLLIVAWWELSPWKRAVTGERWRQRRWTLSTPNEKVPASLWRFLVLRGSSLTHLGFSVLLHEFRSKWATRSSVHDWYLQPVALENKEQSETNYQPAKRPDELSVVWPKWVYEVKRKATYFKLMVN